MAAENAPASGRKLTAEELAAQDVEQPATKAAAFTGAARLATAADRTFQVGDILITADGVDCDAATADLVRAAAAQSGVALREL